MRREFLQLAKPFVFGKYCIGEWLLSEKLDGIRCYWDGGITRGLRCDQVPWANIEKHDRFKNVQYASGLWSRYAQPIQAPGYWLDKLPKIPLDGELTMGRNSWQGTSSCVKQQTPDERWAMVFYAVFDSPAYDLIFEDGVINNPPHFKKALLGIMDWVRGRSPHQLAATAFFGIQKELHNHLPDGQNAYLLRQIRLPLGNSAAENVVKTELKRVTDAGGEGVMLRNPYSIWSPTRTSDLFKVKGMLDAEATVIGYRFAKGTDMEKSRTGEQTDKLLGLMGSLIVTTATGIKFELSGFTDMERVLYHTDYADLIMGQERSEEMGRDNPGEICPPLIASRQFPRGTTVTYRYRELSDIGIPKEARYWRKTE